MNIYIYIYIHIYINIARNKNLELFTAITFTNRPNLLASSFYNSASNDNKRDAIIELRNENEQNGINYGQLRKSKIYVVKKFQTTNLSPTL